MRQTEYLLKGLYLGLVLFAALQQAEASPAGSWDSLARVNLSTLAGLGLALGLAAVGKLREGYRVKGRLVVFVLFLLLESPQSASLGSFMRPSPGCPGRPTYLRAPGNPAWQSLNSSRHSGPVMYAVLFRLANQITSTVRPG